MWSAVLCSLLAVQGDGKDTEAEKIFRALEAKLTTARSVTVVVEADIDGSEFKPKMTAKYVFAPGNKARIDATTASTKMKEFHFALISNGARLKISAGTAVVAVIDTHAYLHDLLVAANTRMGTVLLMKAFSKEPEFKGNEVGSHFPVSDLRMGPDEKIDGRATRVIHYRIGPKGDGMAFTLWLDARTLLPLKRVSTVDAKAYGITEVYREFTLDAKVDASTFDPTK
jgi:outer membrane lipoprotein-sorting protein